MSNKTNEVLEQFKGLHHMEYKTRGEPYQQDEKDERKKKQNKTKSL